MPASPAIPPSLAPHFQEYDLQALDVEDDAILIIQRTLEYGSWPEIRWLFGQYGSARVCDFVRDHGDRMLSAVPFTYWRKLLRIRDWRPSPFAAARSQVWNR